MTISPEREKSMIYYSNANEMRFIDGLGTFGTEIKNPKTRKELLSLYIQSSEKRSKWGGMGGLDKSKILSYAMEAYIKCKS